MSEEAIDTTNLTDVDSGIAEFFNSDMKDVDITRPLIKPGNVTFNIAKSEIVDAKDGLSKNWVLTLKTAFPQQSTKGREINPGFTVTHRVNLNPVTKDGEDRKEMIQADIKRIKMAVFGGDGSGKAGHPSLYANNQVTCKVVVESDKNGVYADQNRIVGWVAKTSAA